MAKVLQELKVRTLDAPWFLIYRRKSENIFYKILMYTMLINIAYIFLYPVFYMISKSLMTVDDFLDPAVYWIPRVINTENFSMSIQAMKYWVSLGNSAQIAILGSLGQLISCALAGYGFGRIKFPGRELLFGLVIFTFIVPPQTIIVPLFILYKNLGWIDTYNPFVIPAFFAHGLRGSWFILIFRQLFHRQP